MDPPISALAPANTPDTRDAQQRLPITGIILAGGAGRRLGGADKGWLDWQGKPLIERAIAILHGDCADIVISANRNLDRYAQWEHPVVSDLTADFQGPLMGLAAGMHAATQAWVASIPVDSPYLPEDIVRRMWQAKGGHDLVVVRSADHWHAVICLCRCDLLPQLQRYLNDGGRRAQGWFQDRSFAGLTLPADLLRNCNHPEDMA
ncbi:molybdenum cofactor guanylyltransferase MobA [Acidithiobacillus sp.]|uniref:molybdenum cofactor guanylyltransferase MobA n=1 Tax=Acidithiobacillus sp. TaxID=1872118 RepID=UPI0025C66930|nr:molybdenum cofactor guanylyltransferase MobA [Acidithiobacillus sp.]MCK9189344.1 molybdenum cofactor guanylyltransferase [Acidithiobacillus sp.]MCK9359064.1 molybdenum cofactor guanylyltransferase [Acidithiobacillus sp.]